MIYLRSGVSSVRIVNSYFAPVAFEFLLVKSPSESWRGTLPKAACFGDVSFPRASSHSRRPTFITAVRSRPSSYDFARWENKLRIVRFGIFRAVIVCFVVPCSYGIFSSMPLLIKHVEMGRFSGLLCSSPCTLVDTLHHEPCGYVSFPTQSSSKN